MGEDITQVIRGGSARVPGRSGKAEPVEGPRGFTIKRILGRGGMGAVYLAQRNDDGELFAVKMLNADLAPDGEAAERFRREARLMLQLNHPNIIRAHGVGMSGGSYYLTMEYVSGETLDARLKREGRIDQRAALPMMRQIADALAYSSRKSIVHRDLKPANVIVREDGVCKLVDMGLAFLTSQKNLRITATGTSVGTPLYMAPEQASAVPDIDVRADIYSFGCMFYHALCGRPPFPGENAVKVMRAHLHESPAPPRRLVPGIREDVEAVIVKCMLKDRERRYQGGADLVQHVSLVQAAVEMDGGTRAAPASRRSSLEAHFPFGDA